MHDFEPLLSGCVNLASSQIEKLRPSGEVFVVVLVMTELQSRSQCLYTETKYHSHLKGNQVLESWMVPMSNLLTHWINNKHKIRNKIVNIIVWRWRHTIDLASESSSKQLTPRLYKASKNATCVTWKVWSMQFFHSHIFTIIIPHRTFQIEFIFFSRLFLFKCDLFLPFHRLHFSDFYLHTYRSFHTLCKWNRDFFLFFSVFFSTTNLRNQWIFSNEKYNDFWPQPLFSWKLAFDYDKKSHWQK